MKTKSLLSRVICSLGALLAVAVFALDARPAVFDEEAEEAPVQPEEAAGAETAGAAIDTSSWDELSKQVLPRVIDSNLDFGTLLRYARKASCTVHMVVKTPQISMPELGSFTVPQGPPSTAQISLSWEDADDDGTIAEDEVKVETALTSDIMMKMAMDRVHKGLKSLVTLNVVNLLTQSTVKAEKKGEGEEEREMRRNIWIALFACLVFLLSVALWPQPAFSEKSLFEEDEEEETAVETESTSSTIQVPRSAEARKLADQVLGRLAGSYQTLLSVGVGRFNAAFNLEEEGKQIGTLTVQFKDGDLSAKVQGVSEEGKQEALEDLYGESVFGVLAGGPLSAAILKGKPVYAVKAGEQFILDLSEAVSKKGGDVTSCVAFVSPDLLKIDKLIVKGDGELWATVYQGEKANGRLLVSSSTVTIQSSGEEMAKIEHAWTYGREQGVVFLRRIRTKISSPGETVNLQIVREKVSLEKPMTLPKATEITEDIEKEREKRLKDLEERIRKALEEEQKKLLQDLEE